MKRKEVYSKLADSISDSYLLAVWSKIKLSEELNEEQVR